MNTDIRLLLSFQQHPKTKKLRRKLGDGGPLSLIYLLMFAAANKPDGILTGMDVEDIALAGDWQGDPGEFVDTLVAVKSLDLDDETYRIHDWEEHNPWAAGAEQRSDHARKAARARHKAGTGRTIPSTNNQALTSKKDATSTNEQCSEHTLSMDELARSNAPSPSPSPNPILSESTAAVPGKAVPTGRPAAARMDYSTWQPDDTCLARIRATDSDITASFIAAERLEFITYAEDNNIHPDKLRANFQSQTHRHWVMAKARELNTGPLRTQAANSIRDIPVGGLEAWSRARDGPAPNAGESADDYRQRILKTLRERENATANIPAIEQLAAATAV
jgi:hypothetical protein